MKSKYLLFGLAFVMGIALGHSFSFLNALVPFIDYPPSDRQSKFVSACSILTSKELTLLNLEKLDGWSWSSVDGELRKPEEQNIARLNNKTDPFFNIYHKKQYDNTWVCSITKTEDNKIEAGIFYQYE